VIVLALSLAGKCSRVIARVWIGLGWIMNSLSSSFGKLSDVMSKFIATILRIPWPVFYCFNLICAPSSLDFSSWCKGQVRRQRRRLATCLLLPHKWLKWQKHHRDWLMTDSWLPWNWQLISTFPTLCSTFDACLCISNWPLHVALK
jgi:hypothetical protein